MLDINVRIRLATTPLPLHNKKKTYLQWHPRAPIIASTTNSGNILLWHCPTPERWGAFAGGFEEIDENVEYEEREDEFDVEDEEEIAKRKDVSVAQVSIAWLLSKPQVTAPIVGTTNLSNLEDILGTFQ